MSQKAVMSARSFILAKAGKCFALAMPPQPIIPILNWLMFVSPSYIPNAWNSLEM